MTTDEIKRRKIEVLNKITLLHSDHPDNGGRCKNEDCSMCEDLRSLGVEYEKLTLMSREVKSRVAERVEAILKKGQFATKSEIKFILEEGGLSRRELSAALKIGTNDFSRICNNWGIKRISSRRTG